MKFKKDSRGVISVFLTIILVPCIVVTFLFVDLGRINMSKAMAQSSADLALDALMTNYDADLKEWYGLMASCQNINQFYEESAKFFVRSLKSKGLSDDEIYLLSDYYANATNDGSIYDLLETECVNGTTGIIGKSGNKTLQDPAMMKRQIVDFMKYRAPIEFTTDLIERLKNDSSFKDAVENSKNEDVVESKKEFYIAESEFLRKAFNTYSYIREYEKSYIANHNNENILTDYVNKINMDRELYYKIHESAIQNLAVRTDLLPFIRVTANLKYYENMYKNDKKITESKADSIIKDLNKKIQNFDTALNDFNNHSAIKNAINELNGANVMQWWNRHYQKVVLDNNSPNKKLYKKVDEMMKAYGQAVKLNTVITAEDKKQELEALIKQVQFFQAKYLTQDSKAKPKPNDNTFEINTQYLRNVSILEANSVQACKNTDSNNVTITLQYQGKTYTYTLEQAIQHVSGELSRIRSELNGYNYNIDVAINGNKWDFDVKKEKRAEKIDNLKKLIKEYNEKLAAWEQNVNARYDELGAEKNDPENIIVKDKEELEKIKKTSEYEFITGINENDVTVLKNRLVNIKSQFNEIIKYIDKMKYCGVKMTEITNSKKLQEVYNNKHVTNKVPCDNAQMQQFIKDTVNKIEPNKNLILEHLGDKDWDPRLNTKDNITNIPKLYKYMSNRFANLQPNEEFEQGTDIFDQGKEDSELSDSEVKDKLSGKYTGNGQNIIREYSGENKFNIGISSLNSVMNLFTSIFNGEITPIRDDLYVTSYIMNMFSYATFNNEGIYKLMPPKDRKNLTLDSYRSKYEKYNTTGGNGWLSTDLTNPYNKTLRNIMINNENNVAFEAEVEYILYGGQKDQTNVNNVNASYNDIYGLRYPLNLISGFTNFWSKQNVLNHTIETIARTITAASQGIIPVEAGKVVMIALLTVKETFTDMDRLQAGFPVEIYKKDAEDWWNNIDNDSNTNKPLLERISPNRKKNKDVGFYYSDYLTAFTYIGLTSNGGNDVYKRIGEVMQTNMRKYTNDSAYSMSNSIVYHELNTKIRVKPLFLDMKIFKEGTYKNDISSNDDLWTYDIKQIRGY